jgi:hypothetical protein
MSGPIDSYVLKSGLTSLPLALPTVRLKFIAEGHAAFGIAGTGEVSLTPVIILFNADLHPVWTFDMALQFHSLAESKSCLVLDTIAAYSTVLCTPNDFSRETIKSLPTLQGKEVKGKDHYRCTAYCQLRGKLARVWYLHMKAMLLRIPSSYWMRELLLHPCPLPRSRQSAVQTHILTVSV